MENKIWLKKTSKQRGNKNKNNHQKYAKNVYVTFPVWKLEFFDEYKEYKWRRGKKPCDPQNTLPSPPWQKHHDWVLSTLQEEQI